MIGLLDTPSEGRYGSRADATGASPPNARSCAATVSFVFQSFNLFPGLTAAENVQFGADVAGRADPAGWRPRCSTRWASGSGWATSRTSSRAGSSSAWRSARALATGNPVLLADEPTGELDFRTGVQILELLRAQAGAGKTVLVVTHNREISRAADRVVELSSGRIVHDGAPRGGRAHRRAAVVTPCVPAGGACGCGGRGVTRAVAGPRSPPSR